MRLGRIAIAVSCLATAYGLVRVFTSFWDFGRASGELPEALRRYQADGLPFAAGEIAPRGLSPDKNPAEAIRAAGRILRPLKSPDVAKLLDGPPAEADAAAARYRPALAAVEGSVGLANVDFGRDWDLGPFILFPEYADMKGLAKAAELRAVRAAQRGDDAAALRDLSLALRLGLWAGQEPTLISLLVRLAISAIALDGVERCVVASAGDAARIARYERWLGNLPPLPSFEKALRGEMFMGVTTARNLDRFGGMDLLGHLSAGDEGFAEPKIDPASLKRDGLPDDAKARAYLARHLQLWSEAYRATDGFGQPPGTIGARLDAIAARIGKERGLSYVFPRVLMPVFAQAGAAIVALDARRVVERGFAGAMAFHAKHGTWPKTVAEIDPFTGAPLRVKAGKDFRVYSVGRDRKDDGGLLKREAAKLGSNAEDLVAAYPPVPR